MSGEIISLWFRCPVCESDRVEWEVDPEHLALSCSSCGSETREYIGDKTSGGGR